jgi:hypothetical protein
MTNSRADIEYDGKIYVRPVGRGVTLLDPEGRPDLDEAIEEAVAKRYGAVSGWTGHARIRVELLKELPAEDF